MKTQWATHSKTALLHTHMHCRKGNQCGCLYGELHKAPTSHSVVSSYAVRSHTRLTCNTLQIMSINKQGMFYLKGRTLIQRHHSSTEKKCCLISVTPLLLPSSRKREREAMCHSCHTDICLRRSSFASVTKKQHALLWIHWGGNGLNADPWILVHLEPHFV